MSVKGNIEDSGRNRSVPALILDLLESRADYTLSVQSLLKAASLFDVQPQALRVALTRLTRQGHISLVSRGVYKVNTESNTLMRDINGWMLREERAIPWNGQWVAVTDSAVPRRNRARWRQHSRALKLRGLQYLVEGFCLRPDNLRGGLQTLSEDLHGLGLAPEALVIGVAMLEEPHREQALDLWDTAALEAQYQSLLAQLSAIRSMPERAPLEETARGLVILGHQAVRTIMQDPLLPDEIMGGATRVELVQELRNFQIWGREIWDEFLAS